MNALLRRIVRCAERTPVEGGKAAGAGNDLGFASARGGPGAPAPDEIVVAHGASTGGWRHHRIGDRNQERAKIDAEVGTGR